MNTKATISLFLLSGCALHPLPAQNIDKSHILQNKIDEQEVREHTSAVVNQVQSLIDELAANGISGDDIKVLNATKAALSNLSGAEMDRVIASLQKAGDATSNSDSQQHVVNAYTSQKGIILQFRQILRDYEQRQAAYELPVRFKELSDRQTDTMMTSADVARKTAGKSATELSTMEQTTQGIVQADQDAILNETNLAIDQLNKAAQDSTQDDVAVLQQAQADIKTGALAKALAAADDSLKAGQFLKALNAQKVARDELRRIAKDLSPPANAVDALADTSASLEKLIAEQKALLSTTTGAIESKTPVTGLDLKQGGLVDEDNSLQQDMQTTSADAAAIVKSAINPMQQSRAALSTNGYTNSVPNQNDAISKLEAADKLLQQQLADAEKAAQEDSKDPIDKLQDLKKQIETTLQQQKQVTAQTQVASNASPPDATATQQAQQNQSALQKQTADLQQTSQPLSLPASQALAAASQAMTQAQQDMTDPNKTPADTQAQQQAAQDALTQADKQIDQQIAQDQQQNADPQALAAAANALQQAQDATSSAEADASSSSSQSSPSQSSSSPGPSSTPPSLSDAEKALAAAAADTQKAADTAGLPNAAADAVKQAQSAIAQGQQQAAKGDAKGTASSAATAEQALAQAQASVAMAQAGLAANSPSSNPGQPGPSNQPAPPGPPGTMPGKPGKQAAKTVAGGSITKGNLHDVAGNGKFVTVASRDRAAIDQTQQEKRPQEYAPMIDQYMKNLADQASSSP